MLNYNLNFNNHNVNIVISEMFDVDSDIVVKLLYFYGDDFIKPFGKLKKNLYPYYLLMNMLCSSSDFINTPLYFSLTDNGKPFIADNNIYFNISHSSCLCAVAVSNTPLGIDIQKIKIAKLATIKYTCTEFEQALIINSSDTNRTFTQFWAYKESYVKALGCGLRLKPKLCEFDIDGNILNGNNDYKTVMLDMQNYDEFSGALTIYNK